jgi:hypothetical protein
LAKHVALLHTSFVSSNFPKELDSPAFISGHFFVREVCGAADAGVRETVIVSFMIWCGTFTMTVSQ